MSEAFREGRDQRNAHIVASRVFAMRFAGKETARQGQNIIFSVQPSRVRGVIDRRVQP